MRVPNIAVYKLIQFSRQSKAEFKSQHMLYGRRWRMSELRNIYYNVSASVKTTCGGFSILFIHSIALGASLMLSNYNAVFGEFAYTHHCNVLTLSW